MGQKTGKQKQNADVLYIVMPAYNEEAMIEKVVRAWYPLLDLAGPASRLVIADAGSTDDTHKILLSLQEEMPKLKILTDSEKQHGPKVMALYADAVRSGADYIFQTDSDGQTEPAEFPAFFEARERFDVQIGHRRVRGDGRARHFVEKTVCAILRILFGVKVPDANAPFRLMRASCLADYLGLLPENYELPNIMLTAFFAHDHVQGRFVPISFYERPAGESSLDPVKIMKTGLRAVIGFLRYVPMMAGGRIAKR